jgi:NTP pyrophosphatase (non-canonical NTP hydrolase)
MMCRIIQKTSTVLFIGKQNQKQIMDLNNLSKEIHAGNKSRGFWDGERNVGELLMLVVSELGEAIEAHRKNRFTDPAARISEINPILSSKYFAENIKDTFEDEIADSIIRLFDMCGGLGIDIDFHIREKLKYNETRPIKHGKRY